MKHPTKLRYLAPETEAIVIQTNQRLCQGSPTSPLLTVLLVEQPGGQESEAGFGDTWEWE